MEYSKRSSIQNVIGDISKGITTWRSLNNVCNFVNFVSKIEPKGNDESIGDESGFSILPCKKSQINLSEITLEKSLPKF